MTFGIFSNVDWSDSRAQLAGITAKQVGQLIIPRGWHLGNSASTSQIESNQYQSVELVAAGYSRRAVSVKRSADVSIRYFSWSQASGLHGRVVSKGLPDWQIVCLSS